MKLHLLFTCFSFMALIHIAHAEDVSVRIEKALKEQELIAQEIVKIHQNTVQRRGQSDPRIEYGTEAVLAAALLYFVKPWPGIATRASLIKVPAFLALLGVEGLALAKLFIEWSHSAGENAQVADLLKQSEMRAHIIEYLQSPSAPAAFEKKTEPLAAVHEVKDEDDSTFTDSE